MSGDDEVDRLRNALRALERSDYEWRATFDALDGCIVVLDQSRRITRLTRDAAKMLLSAGDPIGRTIAQLAGHAEPWTTITKLLELPPPSSATAYDPMTDRTWLVDIASGGPEASFTIVTARDCTNAIHLEQEAADGRALAAMGALVAGVAHEVRNPLFGISATLDAFDLSFGEHPEHAQFIRDLRGQVNRLSALMADLLEYGRPMELRCEPLSVADLVEEAIITAMPAAAPASIRIDVVSAESLPPIHADRHRMLQVFRNLLENAIQHSPVGAGVTIDARESVQDERWWVDIFVKDNGNGFREQDLPRVFEPFFSRRRGGTGLGLALVKRIIYKHHGYVYAANHVGGGAVLMIRLPAYYPGRQSFPPAGGSSRFPPPSAISS